MGEVIPMYSREELVAELAVIDRELEPLERRAEDIRRLLGLLAVERGVEG